jgi:hypothetical protein
VAAVGPVLDGPFAPGWYSAHTSGDTEFLIGRCPGPDHPTRLPRRTDANQAAFPDIARLLPVMVPALAHASRSAGLLDSSSSVPWRTTAYTVPAEAG